MKRLCFWVLFVAPIWAIAAPTLTFDEAKSAVNERLSKPSGTAFRNVRRGDEGTVCGEVSVKNRRGERLPFAPFVAQVDSVGPRAHIQQDKELLAAEAKWRDSIKGSGVAPPVDALIQDGLYQAISKNCPPIPSV